MSLYNSSTRGTELGSQHNAVFSSTGSFKYLSTGSENEPVSATGEAAAPNLIIWGTNVNVETCKKQFIEFIKESRFTIETAEMDEAKMEWQLSDEPRPLYLTKLEEIAQCNDPILSVNSAHIREFNLPLYEQLVKYPTEVVQIFDMAANEIFQELYPEQSENMIICVRPFNINQTVSIRHLNPTDVGCLVTLSGMVTRCSTIVPEMTRAFFKCTACSFTCEVDVENGKVREPSVCTKCNSKFVFAIVHNRCKFIDKQLVKLQEAPDDMPVGQTPSTIALVATSDLVDKVSPGDRIYITGVFRSVPVRPLPFMRRIRMAYRSLIDVVHYRRIKSGRLHDESLALRLNPDRVDRLKALAKDEEIYNRLANSLCPSIFGHIDVKKGILLQLFGGKRKEPPGKPSDPKLRHYRSEINVLLCGDPGTSKSQILQYVYKLVPRGQYTSGKGSSAVGLTAYVTRDIDTKQLVLQTGALVMCDGGICCIDEFDKMSDSTRSVLHEVMEQQTISIAKAGIVCQLNARTSVLAAANPVNSEWDQEKTVIDNVKLPDTLLSRFDLIFLILDPNSVEYDRLLAKHLIDAYHASDTHEGEDDLIGTDLLKDYIAYARSNVQPRLTEESGHLIVEHYVALREDCRERRKGGIVSYPRNLESLIRLSEAHARMRYSNVVEASDVEEALRLTKEALKHSSVDPVSGRIHVEHVTV